MSSKAIYRAHIRCTSLAQAAKCVRWFCRGYGQGLLRTSYFRSQERWL
jgi:hypothetical protein